MMPHDIEEYIAQIANLSVQENIGGRFRIEHASIGNRQGSLWFQAYADKYRLYPTGVVINFLNLKGRLGESDGQDMGRDQWFVTNLKDVKKVISAFSEIKI